MKQLNPNVRKFTVKGAPAWTCEISELPAADYSAKTSEKSEVSQDYPTSDDNVKVTVHCGINGISVQVFDEQGKEIEEFEISEIEEAN